ncbi:hypothetical protein SNE40_016832 [Patella caerulea]|uniref:Endonuclease V n=1 Tax=Patella caerulea TaxID=87958 RepID=A0AAN8JCM7_PATCE
MDFCNRCGYMLKIEGICSICSSLELQYNSHLPSEFCSGCGYLTQNANSFRCQACDESNRKTDSSRVVNGTVSCKCEFCQGNGFREIVIDIRSFCWTNSHDSNVETSKWTSDKESVVSEVIRESWKREQNMLKAKMILEDSKEVSKLRRAIEKNQYGNEKYYLGGMDISFIKGDDVNACAALVILSFPSLEVVYEDYEMIELTAPYIPGFLAFREASFLVDRYHKLISTHPHLKPTVIFLDGNGLLHPREFGVACHVGVLLDTPCLGVAKNLIHLDAMDSDANFKTEKLKLKKGGDVMPLIDNKNDTLGMALRSLDSTTNPIYISSGHLVSLDTAVILVKVCCKYRIPEPVRQADLNSREFLRQKQAS